MTDRHTGSESEAAKQVLAVVTDMSGTGVISGDESAGWTQAAAQQQQLLESVLAKGSHSPGNSTSSAQIKAIIAIRRLLKFKQQD